MVNIKYVMIVLMLSIVFVAGCSSEETQETPDTQNTPETQDINSQGMQNDVMAVVDGTEITSDKVASIQQSFLQQGQQISESDALEQAINQEVLVTEAENQGYTVSTQEAEELLQAELAMQNSSLQEYKQMLTEQGASYEENLKSIKGQLATQSFVDDNLGDIQVTEEEASALYEQFKAQSTEEVPSYEEVKEEIMLTVEQQKRQQATNALIESIKEKRNIEYK